jgi:hypothetical protein
MSQHQLDPLALHLVYTRLVLVLSRLRPKAWHHHAHLFEPCRGRGFPVSRVQAPAINHCGSHRGEQSIYVPPTTTIQ